VEVLTQERVRRWGNGEDPHLNPRRFTVQPMLGGISHILDVADDIVAVFLIVLLAILLIPRVFTAEVERPPPDSIFFNMVSSAVAATKTSGAVANVFLESHDVQAESPFIYANDYGKVEVHVFREIPPTSECESPVNTPEKLVYLGNVRTPDGDGAYVCVIVRKR